MLINVKKSYIIIGILIFIVVSYLVLVVDTKIGTVRFRSKGLVINQTNPKIKNKNVDISIKQSEVSAENKKLDLKTQNVDVKSYDVNVDNKNNIKKQISDIDNYDINYSGGGSEGTETRLKNIARAINNNKFEGQKLKIGEQKRYKYENVSWNSWKSNIINKFLEDSVYIKSLDDYGMGTWFYYSFIVTKYGEIEDVKVKSMYLSEHDKTLVKRLIKSYAHKDITVFPVGTKRESVKVDAIVLLGDSESKAKPSDFHDFEKIKTEY